VAGQVAVAFLDRVEAGLRAERGEPRRPDVRRHEVGVRPGVERHFQQIARIEAEDGPAVGSDVADPREAGRQPVGAGEIGQIDQVVDLARALALLVDGRNLGGEHEAHRRPAGRRQGRQHLGFEVRPQGEQAVAGRHELVLHLGQPRRMHAIAGGDHRDALARRPPGKVFQVEVAAGGAGMAGMYVQVGVERHDGAGLVYSIPRIIGAGPPPEAAPPCRTAAVSGCR
jgi:hypothetical protein